MNTTVHSFQGQLGAPSANKVTARGKPFNRNHHAVSLMWMGDRLCCEPTAEAINAAALEQWGITVEIDEAGDITLGGSTVTTPRHYIHIETDDLKGAFFEGLEFAIAEAARRPS